MTDSTAPDGDVSEESVRERIVNLMRWAEDELDLLSSAFRGCTPDELEELRRSQGVPHLPPAYREFMARMGGGGVGSAIAELFPGDDVAFDAMVPADDWLGARHAAHEVLREHGVDFDLDGHVVIRTFRTTELDFVALDGVDPVVFGVRDADGPEPMFESLTGWLEHRIGRAIKRRFPLRDSHLHIVEPPAADEPDEGEDWFASFVDDQT
jgi:hypothetical protein